MKHYEGTPPLLTFVHVLLPSKNLTNNFARGWFWKDFLDVTWVRVSKKNQFIDIYTYGY